MLLCMTDTSVWCSCGQAEFQTELVEQVDQKHVTPGDIMVFELGGLFPGDIRLLTSKHLIVPVADHCCSQLSLTGESKSTEKMADIKEDEHSPPGLMKYMCFMSTNVISGNDTSLVILTGSRTYMSTIFSTIGKQKPLEDFESGVWRIPYVLVGVMLIIVTVTILAEHYTSHELSESIIFVISVACALTPQMLPLIVNTSLVQGALTMAKDSSLRLTDCLLAARDILCIDKTGTLTMDGSILTDHLERWVKHERRKFLERYMITKGALEEVMKVCSSIERIDTGAITEFSDDEYRRISLGEDISNEGLRTTVRVAAKRLRLDKNVGSEDANESTESDTMFPGLTFFDPPKDTAKEALRSLARKGVKAKVLTTGISVAKDISDIVLLEKDLNVLAVGVESGRMTFGNTMKYIKMSVIANVGSAASLLIATLFLRFEPWTLRQLLKQNFLYSVGQTAIPWDNMAEDYIKVPQSWSQKGMPMFILWNDPACMLCDATTLLFDLFYYQTY
ncbi:hypothetical protein MLD38_031336 [Melastoma candidum]|uniref:Uncharacterized protein n=1 Tax=Melastoma candidum TaxID=119954 RepID=A0ACB9MNS0_9MYRT|nr:hypothetical protein MLD38_031336 [Melastoma candidum]